MEDSISLYILSVLLGIFVLVAVVAFGKWKELTREKKLKELVEWSAIGDYSPALGRNSYTSDLYIAIHNAQFNEAIDKKYRFAEGEKQYILEIIDAYQKDIIGR